MSRFRGMGLRASGHFRAGSGAEGTGSDQHGNTQWPRTLSVTRNYPWTAKLYAAVVL